MISEEVQKVLEECYHDDAGIVAAVLSDSRLMVAHLRLLRQCGVDTPQLTEEIQLKESAIDKLIVLNEKLNGGEYSEFLKNRLKIVSDLS